MADTGSHEPWQLRSSAAADELEAELDSFPEERAEILLEASQHRVTAREFERAIELSRELVEIGDNNSRANARVVWAESLFGLGSDGEAARQLDLVRQERPSDDTPFGSVAELLLERGDHKAAHTWFTMAIARMTGDQVSEDDEPLTMYANAMFAGRRECRQQLGLPPDDLDRSVVENGNQGFSDPEAALDDGRTPATVRVLFWPRAEIRSANARWPDYFVDTDPDDWIAERERLNHDLMPKGAAKIILVPITVPVLAEFCERNQRDPLDRQTRRDCMNEIADRGATIAWPPPRNAPCWCGTRRKYKQCCGRPTSR